MYAVTGASGQLGRLVIESLLGKVAPSEIVALARTPERVADLAAKGVTVRAFDYDAAETLAPGLAGVTRLLLISGNAIGSRVPQHKAVIDAAKTAGVQLIAYTSLLRAQTSPMQMAVEHKATEELLAASGVPAALLRNGWYTENYLMSAGPAIAHGVLIGSAGEGLVSGAGRADYAEAAAVVLARGQAGIFELAGDSGFTHAELAAALAEASGKPVAYQDVPEADYAKALEGAGLPGPFAAILADSDARVADGALFDESKTLSGLIGRPTTPWRETIAAGVRG
ncbi:SDR family NAD(P)-dependent oxidoreductase [Sphingomonas sp. ABOLE]|uniref:SDR family oxidoreductase n=1 Tax=Sphingomonas sp. ABOLE TaxID=1985878 RepID=UPI000F7E42E4|nr:SDR family oxidoreductase [Sphingomonas sp. ABOLE]RSV40091.1 SDR family NAD(P)-dependent oxidoreductase [Sphingomonas sp. ABOLE]